jgi:hypothetical protein
MNQGTYALALIQGLSDLNTKAKQMAARGFYHGLARRILTRPVPSQTGPKMTYQFARIDLNQTNYEPTVKWEYIA